MSQVTKNTDHISLNGRSPNYLNYLSMLWLAILFLPYWLNADVQIYTSHCPYFANQEVSIAIKDTAAYNANAQSITFTVQNLVEGSQVYTQQATRVTNQDLCQGCFSSDLSLSTGTFKISYGSINKDIKVSDNAQFVQGLVNYFKKMKSNSADSHLGLVHTDSGLLNGIQGDYTNGFFDASDVRRYPISSSFAAAGLVLTHFNILTGMPIPSSYPLLSLQELRNLIAHGISFVIKMKTPLQNNGRNVYWQMTPNAISDNNISTTGDNQVVDQQNTTNSRRYLIIFNLIASSIALGQSSNPAHQQLANQALTLATEMYNQTNSSGIQEGATAWGDVGVRGNLGLANVAMYIATGNITYRARAYERANDIIARQMPAPLAPGNGLYGYFVSQPISTNPTQTSFFPRYGSAIQHLIYAAALKKMENPLAPNPYQIAVANFFTGYVLKFQPEFDGGAFGRVPEMIYKNGVNAPSNAYTYPNTNDKYVFVNPAVSSGSGVLGAASSDNNVQTNIAAAGVLAADHLQGIYSAPIKKAAVRAFYGICGYNHLNTRTLEADPALLGPVPGPQLSHYSGGVGNLPGGIPAPVGFVAVMNGFYPNFAVAADWQSKEWYLEYSARLVEALSRLLP